MDGSILSHYVLITDLSILLYRQNKTGRKVYYCRRCLNNFRTQEKLNDHAKYCKTFGAQKTILPDDTNKFVEFKNYRYKIPAPFDFEAINDKNTIEEHKTTEKLTNHQMCSYGYKLVCTVDDRFRKPV